jgi:hypothetical protein
MDKGIDRLTPPQGYRDVGKYFSSGPLYKLACKKMNETALSCTNTFYLPFFWSLHPFLQ